MLPGFRFIVMTLMLATSVLIFGLGAAALLRATHEQFASMPLRSPEQHTPATFAERFNPTGSPTLSMLRVDDPPAQATAPEHAAAKDAGVANLNEQPGVQPAKDDEPAARPKSRKRLTQTRRARIRSATIQKRRLPGRRITLTGLKSSSDAFTPLLSSQ